MEDGEEEDVEVGDVEEMWVVDADEDEDCEHAERKH